MFKKKKMFALATALLLLVSLLSVGIYTQLIRPLSISETLIWIEPFSEDELAMRKDYFQRYSSGLDNGGNQLLRLDEPFPSENATDYCRVRIYFVFKNRSIQKAALGDGYILNTDDADFVIYKRPIAFASSVEGRQTRVSEDCYELFCYRQGMTDDELFAAIKTLVFRSYFETKISNSLHMKYTLSDAKQISFEELEAVRGKYQ